MHHRLARWNWSGAHYRWSIRNWKRVHWTDESHIIGVLWMAAFESGGIESTACHDGHVIGTSAFAGGGVAGLGCIYIICVLDVHVLVGNLNDIAYRNNVLNPHTVPHFHDHILFERPMFINDNPTAHSSHCYIIQAARGD